MADFNIEKRTEELIAKIIEDLGYVLYDVEYVKEGKEYHLCIYIDKDGGIDINDCEKVTEAVNPILDDMDFIKNTYFLEVSSSGLEKKLRKKFSEMGYQISSMNKTKDKTYEEKCIEVNVTRSPAIIIIRSGDLQNLLGRG